MKHLIVITSFAFLATAAFAQSFDRSPTDPTMPSATYDPTAPAVERQVERDGFAATGSTRSAAEISTEAQSVNDYTERNVEQREGYFDSGR
jgi:hypothetical protein